MTFQLSLNFWELECSAETVTPITWSDQDIEFLRDGLLKKTLSDLCNHRAGPDVKREALQWMLSDEIHPFSFIVCCMSAGLDSDELRSKALYTLNKI